MIRFSRALAPGLLTASAALALASVSPALAGPGKDHHARHMAAHLCGMAGGKAEMRRLTVTGQGEARVAPDLATVQLGVTTQAETAAEAMRENSALQGAVIDALKAAGVAEKDIQTSGLNLNPVMEYGENRSPRINGYQASNMVAIRVTEMASLGIVLDAIVDAGANEINGISFGREDAAEVEDEARRAAVADARHKAEVLAEAAGLTLGPVLLLRDNPASPGPRPMMRMAADAAASESVPVQAGELSMAAMVEMEYALIGGMEACGDAGGGKHHHGMQKAGKPGKGGGHGEGAAAPDGNALPEGHPPVPDAEADTPPAQNPAAGDGPAAEDGAGASN